MAKRAQLAGEQPASEKLAGEKSALAEGVANANNMSTAAKLPADNMTANEAETKAPAATPQASPLNRTNISAAGVASLAGLSADKNHGSEAELTEGAAKEAGRQTSAGSATFSGATSNPTTQAVSSPSPLVATPTAQTHGNTAQILAEHADLKVQAQVSEQDAKAEQSTRSTNIAPDTAARSTAPEWLAQIEHGKRWTQGSVKSDGVTQTSAESSVLLGEKSTAARAINAALAKSDGPSANANADPESTESVSVLAANAATSGLSQVDTQQTNGQEASGLLINREQTLMAATPERTAMLDKALTLHGSAEQNAKQLAQQAQVVVSQNLQEADIKLNPSEFGAMRIQIRMEQGEVQVQFVASHPQARELLEQALPRLREMLQQQGMNLQQGGQPQSGQQQPGQNANANLLSQGFGQSGAGQSGTGQGEPGQSGQQPSDQQASQPAAEGANTQWRSYSASGDEVQERGLDNRARALYGSDGARIDFFA